MANKLEVGTRRVGDFYDGDPDTPTVKVTLERSEEGIFLTVPWSEHSSPYAHWYLAGLKKGRPLEPEEQPDVPKRVMFQDSHGAVLLIGCWAEGFHLSLFGPGTGTLWASVAILGPQVDMDFGHPHGLQSEISGLRAWLGVSSWKRDLKMNAEVRTMTMVSTPVPPIELAAREGNKLTLQPTWHWEPEEADDSYLLRDLVLCRTRSAEALTWEEQLKPHRSIRDLLVLSSWRDESLVVTRAHRRENSKPAAEDGKASDQWHNVVTPIIESATPPSGRSSHLIRYGELGEDGLRGWLVLRDEFSRALDPVISSKSLRGATENTLLAHTGPGLEALGYLLLLRDGMSRNKAASASLLDRLNRILVDLRECLPFDGEAWAVSTKDIYNALKHANRTEPDSVDVLNAWERSVLVVRAWVATELGVPCEDLSTRLAQDPQSKPYVRRR